VPLIVNYLLTLQLSGETKLFIVTNKQAERESIMKTQKGCSCKTQVESIKSETSPLNIPLTVAIQTKQCACSSGGGCDCGDNCECVNCQCANC
jgi:hypothetical protein